MSYCYSQFKIPLLFSNFIICHQVQYIWNTIITVYDNHVIVIYPHLHVYLSLYPPKKKQGSRNTICSTNICQELFL